MEKITSELRVRMSAKDAHYGGNLVDGAHMLHLFGDVATELLIRCDGDEGLFCAYDLSLIHILDGDSGPVGPAVAGGGSGAVLPMGAQAGGDAILQHCRWTEPCGGGGDLSQRRGRPGPASVHHPAPVSYTHLPP